MAAPTFSVFADDETHSEGFLRPAKKVLSAKERAGLQDSGQKFPKAKQPTSFPSSRKQPSATGGLSHSITEKTTISSKPLVSTSSNSEPNSNDISKSRSSSVDSNSAFVKYQEKLSERRVEIAALVQQILQDNPEEFMTVPEMGMEPDLDADIGSFIFPRERMEAALEKLKDHKPLRLRGLRDVSNMEVVKEEEIDIPVPVIDDEDYC